MKTHTIREKLCHHEPLLCTRLAYQDPGLVELVARLGVDCVWICTEHVRIDPSRLRSLITAVRCGGAEALVRVRPSGYSDLIQVLEMGANGLMIPWVKTAEEVREIVRMCKFHPQGRRGFDGSQIDADYGLKPMVDYLRDANESTFLVIQIETPEAVENLDEIAAVEGVDVLFLGPNDMSINMGLPGEISHPKITEIAKKVVQAAERNGKMAGTTCSNPEAFARWREMGFRFINYGSDYRMIRGGYEALIEDARASGFGKNANLLGSCR
jgi:4-hydroxy-2-oxoheptanedioate aldolase